MSIGGVLKQTNQGGVVEKHVAEKFGDKYQKKEFKEFKVYIFRERIKESGRSEANDCCIHLSIVLLFDF